MRAAFQFGNFKFSPAGGLSRNGVHIHLQPRAQRILSYLIENEGIIVPHEELMQLCGGSATRASVSQTVSQLRSALGDVKGELIKGVYGQGIRFLAQVTLIDDAVSRASPVNAAVDVRVISKRGKQPSLAQEAGPARHTACDDLVRTALELAAMRTDERLVLALGVLERAAELYPAAAIVPSLQADIEAARIIKGYVPCHSHAARAMKLAERALSLEPGHASAQATHGWLTAVFLNDIPEGMRILNAATTDGGRPVLASFYKAWLLIGLGELGPAMDELDRALIVNPSERGILGLKGWLLLGQGRTGEAAAFLEQHMKLRPDVELLKVLHALLILRAGHNAEAMAEMTRLAELYPNDRFIEAHLAWCMAATGRTEEAHTMLARRLRGGGSYVAPSQLALIYWTLGDRAAYDAQQKVAALDRDPWRLLMWTDPRLTCSPPQHP